MIILSVGLYHLIGLTGVILGIAISFLPYSFVIYKEFKNTKIDFSLIRNRAKFITNSFAYDFSTKIGQKPFSCCLLLCYLDKAISYSPL